MKKTKLSLAILATSISLLLASCGGTTSQGSSAPTSSSPSDTSSTTSSQPTTSIDVVVREDLDITLPTKVTYEFGDAIDLTGLVVTKVGYNASDEIIERETLTEDQYTLDHYNRVITDGTILSVSGVMKITVTAGELTGEFSVTIGEADHFGLEVSGLEKTTYEFGDELDLTGLVVEEVAYAPDGHAVTRKAVAEGEYTLAHHGVTVTDGTILSVSGEMRITVTSGELTGNFTITVNPAAREVLEVTGPTKTTYQVGETLDLTGLVVNHVAYNDEGTKIFTEVFDETLYTVTIDGEEATNQTVLDTAGTVVLTITHRSLTATVNLLVEAPLPTYSVTLNGLGEMKLIWFYEGGTQWVPDRGEIIQDITTQELHEGDKIGFSIDPESEYYVLWDDISIDGASLTRKYIGDDELESFFFTVGKEDITITFNNLRGGDAYGEYDFVGTYTVYDLSDGTTPHTLVVDAGGTVQLDDGTAYQFTYDPATGEFTVEYNGKLAFNNGAILFNKQYIGFKNGTIDHYYYRSSNEYIFVANVEGETKFVYKYYDYLLTEGTDLTVTYNGDTLDETTLITLSAPADEDGDSCLSLAMGYGGVDRVSVPGQHLVYVSVDGTSMERVDRDGIQGTYTLADNPDLVLDGFGNYTLGEVTGTYEYDEDLSVLTLDGTDTYSLDTEAHTYEPVTLITEDPWTDKAYTYTNGTLTLVFENGKVTLTDTEREWFDAGKEITYTVSNGVVSFSLYHDWYTENYETDISLFIESDLSKITIQEDVRAEGMSWGTLLISAGTVLTLVTE